MEAEIKIEKISKIQKTPRNLNYQAKLGGKLSN
jgi:hypothetical protein